MLDIPENVNAQLNAPLPKARNQNQSIETILSYNEPKSVFVQEGTAQETAQYPYFNRQLSKDKEFAGKTINYELTKSQKGQGGQGQNWPNLFGRNGRFGRFFSNAFIHETDGSKSSHSGGCRNPVLHHLSLSIGFRYLLLNPILD